MNNTINQPFILDTAQKRIAMHDALSDYVIAPLGRVNHLQGLMVGISLQANNIDTNEGALKSEDFEEIGQFIKNMYPDCAFTVNTTSRGKSGSSFYMYVMKELEFKAFVFASSINNFISYVLPAGDPMIAEFNKNFFRYLPGKRFTVHQFDSDSLTPSSIDESDTVTYDAFYPFIEGGVKSLFDEYYKSRSRLMIFTGPPGTGKSSLMRAMLGHTNDKFILLDDPSVYDDPEKFGNFISQLRRSSKDERVTVFLEEADKILHDKTEGSGALERLLSLASGVIEHNIKMVIASNIENVDKIYPALVRGGRAFRVIEFRELNVPEANTARAALGLPSAYFSRTVPLASALNFHTDKDAMDRAKRSVGFLSR